MSIDPINQPIVNRLSDQVHTIITDNAPDYRFIDHPDLHTHTIDDIPQLQMLFNTQYMGNIFDMYHNDNCASGFICYYSGLLINYGQFQYNNNLLQTDVIFPLSYNNSNVNYTLHYNKVLEYIGIDAVYEPIDNTYDIMIVNKYESGFVVKSPQLYIPESIKYNYFTIGFTRVF